MVKIDLGKLFQAIIPSNRIETKATISPLPPTSSISQSEQRALLHNTHVPNKRAGMLSADDLFTALSGGTDVLSNYFMPTRDRIADRKRDSEQMRALAPEIGQAAAILIPSILSPNDLQNNSLIYTIEDAELGDEEKKVIIEVIKNHFDKLKLANRLGEWLTESFYGSGAKPVMILPESYLEALIDKNKVGTESVTITKLSIDTLEKKILDSTIYSSTKVTADDLVINKDTAILSSIKIGLESIYADEKTKPTSDKHITEIETAILQLVKSKDLLSIHDNPLVAGLCDLKKNYTKAKLKKKSTDSLLSVAEFNFAAEPMITLDDIDISNTNELGNPLLLELPTEAVIPVFTPGSPNDHLGYFVLINENGNPVEINEQYDDNKITSLKSSFNAMFGKYGMLEVGSKETDSQRAIGNIYEAMLNKYIMKSLNNMEVTNVDISKNPNIYKCMFRRLLENKMTRLVFVPTNLLIYYRFNYHSDGTGKSKLEDVKFALSLKITLMVSKILAIMDEAIVRQKVKVSFDDKNSNNLETMKLIKNTIIEKKMMDFTYNPNQIIESIAQRGLTIVPDKIPGLETFSVDVEPNQRTTTKPDDTLAESLDNTVITGLGIPHSAFNKLSENEYSRSLATVDLFFSRQISDYQQKTCEFTSSLLRAYITFSKPIKEAILDKLYKERKENKTDIDSAMLKKLNKVIDSITISLPSPNIAPDKAAFEDFSSYSEMIDKLLLSLYSNELLEKDSEAATELTMIKAMIRSNLLRNYLFSSGFGSSIDVPELEKMDTRPLIDIQRAILNFRKRMEDNKNMVGKKEDGSGEQEF